MENELKYDVNALIERYPVLETCKDAIVEAYNIIINCYENGGKLLFAGNGGSCSDSEHIVGELMKGFRKKRPITEELSKKLMEVDAVRGEELTKKLQCGLPCIALDAHQSLNTAYTNDVENGGILTFAQQLLATGKSNDVFFAISTSGNSKNTMYAAVVAKALGMKVIGLTGSKGGELSKIADVCIKAPETETFMVQELHLPIYHCLCLMIEDYFFNC